MNRRLTVVCVLSSLLSANCASEGDSEQDQNAARNGLDSTKDAGVLTKGCDVPPEPVDAGPECKPPERILETCTDFETIYLYASKLCGGAGSAIQYGDDPSCPEGASEAWVSCCGSPDQGTIPGEKDAAALPQPVDAGLPVSDSRLCNRYATGDGVTCVELESLRRRAIYECSKYDVKLSSMEFSEDGCAGGSTEARFECCGADVKPLY